MLNWRYAEVFLPHLAPARAKRGWVVVGQVYMGIPKSSVMRRRPRVLDFI